MTAKTRPDAGVSRETWRELLALADVLRRAERLGAAEDVPEGARWIQLSDTLATMMAERLERAGGLEGAGELEVVQPPRLFKAIGKEDARVHLCTREPRFPPVSPTYVICGRPIKEHDGNWMEFDVSLVDFLLLEEHCINCEMMLRAFAWDRLGLVTADLIDRGYVSLVGPRRSE